MTDLRTLTVDFRMNVDPEQAHAAAVRVCQHATDPDDARRLLDMLGLLGGQP